MLVKNSWKQSYNNSVFFLVKRMLKICSDSAKKTLIVVIDNEIVSFKKCFKRSGGVVHFASCRQQKIAIFVRLDWFSNGQLNHQK